MADKTDKEVTDDESALYDRQIRLWGLEAQKRIKNSHLCVLAKNVNGLVNEILKNIILAGIGHVTLISDHQMASERDLASAFSVYAALYEQKKTVDEVIDLPVVNLIGHQLRKLNPSVTVDVKTDMQLMYDETYFSSFDVVIMTDLGLSDMVISMIKTHS
jgi:ubiquitin-like 1-activating enzyme E1 A